MADAMDDRATPSRDPRSAARRAAALDLAVSVVATMLVWPFPVMRRAVSLPVHVVLIFVATIFVGAAVHFWSVRWKHRTLGMYFFGLKLESVPGAQRLAVWAFLRSLLSIPSVLVSAIADPQRGAVAKASGMPSVEE